MVKLTPFPFKIFSIGKTLDKDLSSRGCKIREGCLVYSFTREVKI